MSGSTVNRVLLYMAILSGLLIISVYFVGFATDTTSGLSALRGLVYAITGRTQSGTFADYPKSTAKLQAGL